jgi:hypothetical protein
MSALRRLPYPGLRAYSRDETDLFFGREDCVNEMVDRLAATHFLAVLGASGSGKSSLVRTGLLDALELGLDAAAGPDWLIADCHPGANPTRSLASALLQAKHGIVPHSEDIGVLEQFLLRGPLSIVEWMHDGNVPAGQNLLILVDQFEELFRYGDYAGRETAETFVSLLTGSAASGTRAHVVITMRSEYLGACALIGSLAEYINKSLYLTRRMTREECRRAIEGPARVIGFQIEPQLVNRLLNDLATLAPWESDRESSQLERLSRQADQLPLMQHVLNRLWLAAAAVQGDEPITLRLADYLAFGQLRGALNQHGGEVMSGLGAALAPTVAKLFRGLVSGTSLATAVRRPTPLAELVQLADVDEAEVRAVVEAFRAPGCNFLRPQSSELLNTGTLVDISHESIIRQWSALSDWLLEEAQDGEYWSGLIAATERHARHQGDLLTGTALSVATEWWRSRHPNSAWTSRHGGQREAVNRFLLESQAKTESRVQAERRRTRNIRLAVASVFVVLSATTLSAWYEKSSLSDYRNRSAAFIADFSSILDDIHEASVIGFTPFETRLLAPEKQFFDYTLNDKRSRDTVSRERMILFHFTYGSSLDRMGDSARGREEFKAAYDLAKAYLSIPENLRRSANFLPLFFRIVTLYSWVLMDAGKYADADAVLQFSTKIEHQIGPALQTAEVKDGMAKVANARSRFYGDANQHQLAYQGQRDSVTLEQQALALAPHNRGFGESLATYRQNMTLEARDLADAIASSDPARAASLRTEAKDSTAAACPQVKAAVAANPLYVGFYRAYVSCIESDADAALDAQNFGQADLILDGAHRLIDPVLLADPKLQSIQIDSLRLLNKSLIIAQNKGYAAAVAAGGEAATDVTEKRRRAQALLARWLDVLRDHETILQDAYALKDSYDSLMRYYGEAAVATAAREDAYRAIRNALAPSVKSFPGVRKYQEIAADVAFQLADSIKERGGPPNDALALYDESIDHFAVLGIFGPLDKPVEATDTACWNYGRKAEIYAELKRADDALRTYRELHAHCDRSLQAYGWDFYLRGHILDSASKVGELLFELARYAEARPLLEYASHWGQAGSTRYLSQMYRSGLGVPRDPKTADELLTLAGDQGMKRFTIPTKFGTATAPFNIYVSRWPPEYPYIGIDDQVRWLREFRDGEIPQPVVDSFRQLDNLAKVNHVSLPALAAYALGSSRKGGAPGAKDPAEAKRNAMLSQAILAAKNATASGGLPQALTVLQQAGAASLPLSDTQKSQLGAAFADLSHGAALAGVWALAQNAAEEALNLDSHNTDAALNRAHALMFLGKTEQAHTLYRLGRGGRVSGGRTFEDAARSDFGEFRKAGRTSPLMDEITRFYGQAPAIAVGST